MSGQVFIDDRKARNMHKFTVALVLSSIMLSSCTKKQDAQTPPALLEKDQLTLGFIKLTDCAPLVVAKELGFFEDEGLNVSLQAQANWKV